MIWFAEEDSFYYHVPKDLNISSSANVLPSIPSNDLLLTRENKDGRMTVLGDEEMRKVHSLSIR